MSALNKKVLLTIAAVGSVAAAVIGGTYAVYTANPVVVSGNIVATGSLSIGRTGSGAVFTMENAGIGASTAGTLTIYNSGTVDGDFSITATSTGDTGTLGAQAHVTIYADTDDTGEVVYDGPLNAIGTHDLGTMSPGASEGHTYYFHVSLPTTGSNAGDNALQGKSVTTTLTVNATQTTA
jgi:spore coat-associated protein N